MGMPPLPRPTGPGSVTTTGAQNPAIGNHIVSSPVVFRYDSESVAIAANTTVDIRVHTDHVTYSAFEIAWNPYLEAHLNVDNDMIFGVYGSNDGATFRLEQGFALNIGLNLISYKIISSWARFKITNLHLTLAKTYSLGFILRSM